MQVRFLSPTPLCSGSSNKQIGRATFRSVKTRRQYDLSESLRDAGASPVLNTMLGSSMVEQLFDRSSIYSVGEHMFE